MDLRKFKELLNKARKQAKLTYEELANQISANAGLEISPQVVGYWCRGQTRPKDRFTLLALCQTLYLQGGLTSLEKINDVLYYADGGALHPQEIEKWFPTGSVVQRKLVRKPLPPPQNNEDKDDDERFVNPPRSVHIIGRLFDFGESSSRLSLPDSEASTPPEAPAPLRGHPVVGVLSVLLIFSFATMSFIWSMSGEEPKEKLSPPSANVTEVTALSTSMTDTVEVPTDTPLALFPEQPTLSSTPTQTTILTGTPSLITPILTSPSEPTIISESAISPSATVESPTNLPAAPVSTATHPIPTATPIPAVIPTTTTPVIPSSTAAVPPSWTPAPTVPPPPTDTPTVPPPPTHTPTVPPPPTHTPTVPPPPTYTPTVPPPPTHTPTVPPPPTYTPTVPPPPTHTPTVPPPPTFTPTLPSQSCDQEHFPVPELVLQSTQYTGDGTKYFIGVTNYSHYTSELFKSAPHLPPCGLNPNSSRTWVRIYDDDDNHIYGYCALSEPQSLESLRFFISNDKQTPPSVHIKLLDRECDKQYRSNSIALATATPTSPDTPKPDLIVSSLTVTSFTEERISYSYEITNIGQAPANLDGASGDHYNVSVQAVLSQDTTFEPYTGDVAAGGTILGSSPLGQLEPGESFSGSFGASARGFNPSHQYLVLMVDWSGVVDESDEMNNTTATYLPPISQ